MLFINLLYLLSYTGFWESRVFPAINEPIVAKNTGRAATHTLKPMNNEHVLDCKGKPEETLQ